MMDFPQSMIALWVVRYGIARNMSSLAKEHTGASVISPVSLPTWMTGGHL